MITFSNPSCSMSKLQMYKRLRVNPNRTPLTDLYDIPVSHFIGDTGLPVSIRSLNSLPEFTESLSMFDVDKLPIIIESEAESARKQVPRIKRLLDRNLA
jgi:hypothetical protein